MARLNPGSRTADRVRPIMELTFEQARVLGALVEKQKTTPDYYPMTVNALVAACNQKNNREPVTAFTDTDVERILGELNDLDLARFTRQSGGRTLKYLHRAPDTLEVDDEQLAILSIMMLRGPQTLAELKSRTERSRPYGIKLAPDGSVWVVLFGSNKLAHINPDTLEHDEIELPRPDARPRRL